MSLRKMRASAVTIGRAGACIVVALPLQPPCLVVLALALVGLVVLGLEVRPRRRPRARQQRRVDTVARLTYSGRMAIEVSDKPVPVPAGAIMLATQKARDGFTFIESVLLGSWSLGGDDPLSVVAHLVADGSTPTIWLAEVWFVGAALDRRPFGAFRVELEGGRWKGDDQDRDELGRALHERLFPVPGKIGT